MSMGPWYAGSVNTLCAHELRAGQAHDWLADAGEVVRLSWDKPLVSKLQSRSRESQADPFVDAGNGGVNWLQYPKQARRLCKLSPFLSDESTKTLNHRYLEMSALEFLWCRVTNISSTIKITFSFTTRSNVNRPREEWSLSLIGQ